jgi:hypothetical protein
MLHLGPDSLGSHLASAYDVPLVALYSVSQSSVSGPRFGSPEKQVCFDAYLRTRNGKPSYSSQESPKSIDLIKPEEIVNAATKLLKLPEKAMFETVYVGEKYNGKIIREFIPTVPLQVANPEVPVEIRMDIHFNENVLAQQLTLCKAIIITNKRINKAILGQYRQQITALVYVVTNEDEPTFIDDIKDLGIPIVLMTHLTPEEIQPKKLAYYQNGKINPYDKAPQEKIDAIKADIDNLYFRSNKLVTDGGKVFMTNVCRITNQEITSDFNYYKVVDIPEFWHDLPFMTVVKRA